MNYAAANILLDCFVMFRRLTCSVINIGAAEGTGYLFDNEPLLREKQATGWRPVIEEDLLKALGAAILSRVSWRAAGRQECLWASRRKHHKDVR